MGMASGMNQLTQPRRRRRPAAGGGWACGRAKRSNQWQQSSETRWPQYSKNRPFLERAAGDGNPSRAADFWYPSRSAAKPIGSSAPGKQTLENVDDIKKPGSTAKVSPGRASASRKSRASVEVNDELRAHYDFDYSKASPNRFVARFSEETVAVALDADVATVFHSSESVNAFLRSAISAMPRSEPRKRNRAS